MNQRIVVIETGNFGSLSAILLARYNEVTVVDLIPAKVHGLNRWESVLAEKEIKDYIANEKLSLISAADEDQVYADADFVVVSAQANDDPEKNTSNTEQIEDVISRVREWNPSVYIVIRGMIPAGLAQSMRERFNTDHILFSPEPLQEGQTLAESLHPSHIIVGADKDSPEAKEKAREFAELLREGVMEKDVPVLIMGLAEAEAVQLFTNTYLAMQSAYFNELNAYAETKGLDAAAILRGIGLDK